MTRMQLYNYTTTTISNVSRFQISLKSEGRIYRTIKQLMASLKQQLEVTPNTS